MTYMQAALTILDYADRPLSIGELTSVAVAQGLVHPRGRTPDRSMSSILYRRMAADPDAPITSANGRFWLRGRPVPERTVMALRPGVRHVRRSGEVRHAAAGTAARPSHHSTLPPPPMLIPLAALPAVPESAASHGSARRDRAAARLAERLRTLAARLASAWQAAPEWDVARTRSRLVAPLLTLLGYRRVDQQALSSAHGRISTLLHAGAGPAVLLECLRAGHLLADADARLTLTRALGAGVPWALLTNGQELRLYATALAQGGPSGALVLRIEPYAWSDDETRLDAARMLWLLSRDAVAVGALDSYLAARAVGAALLAALDEPDSPLVRALGDAVRAATGLELTTAQLARQARLAVRGPRGRDGEPPPSEIAAVAAVADHPIGGSLTDQVAS